MKLRQDFVTNSSSSSFIAVFGTAINEELAYKTVRESKLDNYLHSGKDLLDDWERFVLSNTIYDWCYVDPFPDKHEIEPNGTYFVYSDYTDVDTNEWGEICQSNLNEHADYVNSKLKNLKGFILKIQHGSGRNG